MEVAILFTHPPPECSCVVQPVEKKDGSQELGRKSRLAFVSRVPHHRDRQHPIHKRHRYVTRHIMTLRGFAE